MTTYTTLAASAASVIAMAGTRREVSSSGTFFLHLPRISDVGGNVHDLAAATKALEAMTNLIGGIYAEHSGVGTVADWRRTMREEGWYVGEQAVDAGLADVVVAERRQVAAASPILSAVREGVREARRETVEELVAAAMAKHH